MLAGKAEIEAAAAGSSGVISHGGVVQAAIAAGEHPAAQLPQLFEGKWVAAWQASLSGDPEPGSRSLKLCD